MFLRTSAAYQSHCLWDFFFHCVRNYWNLFYNSSKYTDSECSIFWARRHPTSIPWLCTTDVGLVGPSIVSSSSDLISWGSLTDGVLLQFYSWLPLSMEISLFFVLYLVWPDKMVCLRHASFVLPSHYLFQCSFWVRSLFWWIILLVQSVLCTTGTVFVTQPIVNKNIFC